MTEPWTYEGELPRLAQADGAVTLVEGTSFCVSSPSGDVLPGAAHGLFFLDTRFLSRFQLRLDGQPLEPLGVAVDEPFSATFFARSHPSLGRADSALVVFRRRHVGRGLREEIVVRNYAPQETAVVLDVDVDVDFADLFEVKERRAIPSGSLLLEAGADGLRFGVERGGRRRETFVAFTEPAIGTGHTVTWRRSIPSRGELTLCIGVTACLDDEQIEPRYRCGEPVEASQPVRRLRDWRRRAPVVETDDGRLVEAVQQATEDLGALRIFDPDFPDRTVVAAGAPWFMTLFGRDSLITSWMALPVDPDLARGTLETLARFQGTDVDPRTEEEPGRILHEMRFGAAASLSLGGGSVYYGTADATPLFVMLLGELRRWGLGSDVVDRLRPHADRAMAWITEFGDRDGDGFVEYARATEAGLANQGWKDSWDGVPAVDGSPARGPIALCEVQGYVYAAYVAMAHFASEAGDEEGLAGWRRRALDLKAAFNRDFWLEDRGWFALALDGDKRPVEALASNIGHCLWTGIVDEDKAPLVAERLLSPELFSGWGVRTLATSMAAYNPVSYHNGSVWPHDNAIVAAGLMRYGLVEPAHAVIDGLLDVSEAYRGRLPELFSGLGRDELSVPAAYPTSCVPQAWAAASPLLFLRTLLRLDPWLPRGRVSMSPALPARMQRLTVRGIPLGHRRVDVVVEGDRIVDVDGLLDLQLDETPRAPVTSLDLD